MGKPYVLIGDKTDHGGVVLEGAPTAKINGKAIARVGDKVSCPKKGHNDTTVIVSGDPDFLIDGKQAARHGDKTACGAILIAGQTMAHDDEGGSGGSSDGPGPGLATTSSPSARQPVPTITPVPAASTAPTSESTAPPAGALASAEALAPAIEQKTFSNLEKGALPEVHAIVLHRTSAPTAASTLNNYSKAGVGAHFLIDTDGHIFQTIKTDKKAYHVGKLQPRCLVQGDCSDDDKKTFAAINGDKKKSFSTKVADIHEVEVKKSYPDRYPSNDDSIGIEVVGDYVAGTDTYVSATSAQLESVKSLVTYLQAKYSLSDKDVYTHSRISYKAGQEGTGLGY